MMQIRATILKLLKAYNLDELLGHIANEVECNANHMHTVGARVRAAHYDAQTAILKEAAEKLSKLEYPSQPSEKRS